MRTGFVSFNCPTDVDRQHEEVSFEDRYHCVSRNSNVAFRSKKKYNVEVRYHCVSGNNNVAFHSESKVKPL